MNVEQMGLIIKRDDGSEVVNYDNPSFPSYIYDGWIEPNCTWERVPHYHEDLEIVTVREGTMAYSVNGRTLVLREGDTIIVNSNQIHYSMSPYHRQPGSAVHAIQIYQHLYQGFL